MGMRRIKSDHWARITFEDGDHQIAVVGRGGRAYLWVGQKGEKGGWRALLPFSGPKSLRKLAKAILKELGE